MPNVQMPNGDVVNFPDDMPREQIKGMIASKFPEVAISSQPKQPGFIDRVSEDLTKRANEGADAIVAYKNNEQGLAQTGTQLLGKMGAGAAGDIAAETIKSAYTSLPDSTQKYLGDKAAQAGDYIASTDIGKAGIAGAKRVGEAYGGFAKNNPNAARTIESVANIASVLPATRAVETVAQPISKAATAGAELAVSKDVGTKLPSILGDTRSGSIRPAPITQDMVRQASKNAYDVVDNSGTTLTPDFTDAAISILDKNKQPMIAGKLLTKESKAINDALEEYGVLKGSPLSMKDLREIDSTLGDKAAQAYVRGEYNQGRIISNAQDEIRNLLKPANMKPNFINGTREGVDALMNDAIPLWATQSKMGDIQKIVDRANMMDNPSTGIKTGFRNLALNKNKMASYPPRVQKLILKAAKTGKTDDLLGVIGSRLNGIIGAGVGGVKGAIIGNVTSTAARNLRSNLKNNQAQRVNDALVEGVRPNIQKYNP